MFVAHCFNVTGYANRNTILVKKYYSMEFVGNECSEVIIFACRDINDNEEQIICTQIFSRLF